MLQHILLHIIRFVSLYTIAIVRIESIRNDVERGHQINAELRPYMCSACLGGVCNSWCKPPFCFNTVWSVLFSTCH